ncbi:putative GMP synthase [Daphnia magna]|uniref:Putative GMP synthase n=1 Tax=Daphnia magna TaxID=35525 RepID=A0A162CN61_9CRUS|nr:putative GMP synthase [Daphnia magna]
MASSRADAIKTHHNDSEMVRQLRHHGRVVEPLKDFRKDEVRALGRELGLPAELLKLHPFPGPALSIRILSAEEPFMKADFGEMQVLIRLMVDYANMEAKERALLNQIEIATSEENRLLLEELSSRNQYLATLMPIRTVGRLPNLKPDTDFDGRWYEQWIQSRLDGTQSLFLNPRGVLHFSGGLIDETCWLNHEEYQYMDKWRYLKEEKLDGIDCFKRVFIKYKRYDIICSVLLSLSRWIVTRLPLNGPPTICSLTVCFINTSTTEITLPLVVILLFTSLSICNFHTTSLPLWSDILSSWKEDSGN